jgi:hypothetical protein
MKKCEIIERLQKNGFIDEGDDNLYDWLDSREEKDEVEGWFPEGSYYSYLGFSWDSTKEDETKKQFKERVEKTLKNLLGNDIKCSTHQEAWRDG